MNAPRLAQPLDPRLEGLDRHLLTAACRSNTPVLITGDTGTGKEFVARQIHENSVRANGPFVVVDCASLSPTVIESELFGHERGAFTGADKARVGLVQQGIAGTIFIDEIGELPLLLQPRLLRLLDHRQIRRVGGEDMITVDVRIIAATLRDLESDVDDGRFRQDLFERLNVLRLVLPPLRDRAAALPELIDHLLQRAAAEEQVHLPRISDAARIALMAHRYPGNVRELYNLLRGALALLGADGGDAIGLEHLKFGAGRRAAAIQASSAEPESPVRDIANSLQDFGIWQQRFRGFDDAVVALADQLCAELAEAHASGPADQASRRLLQQLSVPLGWYGRRTTLYALATAVRWDWSQHWEEQRGELADTTYRELYGSTHTKGGGGFHNEVYRLVIGRR